jgi:ferredoxin-type protein NapG
MTDAHPENIPLAKTGPAPANTVANGQPAGAPAASPEIVPSTTLPTKTSPAPVPARPHERRDFFSEAMREAILPFYGLIERKINPILAALEQIPDEAERLANNNFGLLDQPSPRPNHVPLHQLENEPQRPLRPPGATTPDDAFESICSRCGNCVAACPANAIQLDANGLLAGGFPYIVAENQPCVVCKELACMKSCPTGALKILNRLDINMGTATVDHQLCLRNHGEACTLCIDVCPIDGKNPDSPPHPSALFISPDTGRIRVRKNVCVGCGLCENRCPTEPRAITVIPHIELPEPIIA